MQQLFTSALMSIFSNTHPQCNVMVCYRDISFLYDVPKPDETPARPDKIDKSVVRKDGTEPTKQVSMFK